MNRFIIGLLAAVTGVTVAPMAASAQDLSGCGRNAIPADRCAAWQSAARTTALSRAIEQLDGNAAALAKDGRISPEKAEAQRASLAASQAAWETFAERHCALPGAHPEGPEACRNQMIRERLAELQDPDLPEPGSEDKSWSKRRLRQSPSYTQAFVTLTLDGPPMRTLADRAALAKGPHETREWENRKQVWDFQKKIREVRGFGPLTSDFIAAEWDMLRFDPETGAPLHQAPERIEGSPADNSWDKNEAEAFASRLPACMRNMADPQCRVHYSPELGCRYDAEMAAFCQAKFDGLRDVFQSYDIADPDHREHFYRAVACLTPAPLGEGFAGTFLASASPPPVEASNVAGGPCSALGLVRDGGGWSASGVPVFGVAMDLEIR